MRLDELDDRLGDRPLAQVVSQVGPGQVERLAGFLARSVRQVGVLTGENGRITGRTRAANWPDRPQRGQCELRRCPGAVAR